MGEMIGMRPGESYMTDSRAQARKRLMRLLKHNQIRKEMGMSLLPEQTAEQMQDANFEEYMGRMERDVNSKKEEAEISKLRSMLRPMEGRNDSMAGRTESQGAPIDQWRRKARERGY